VAAGLHTLGHDEVYASRGGTSGLLGAPNLEHHDDAGSVTTPYKGRRITPEE
jgi:hypothetical protein